MSPVSHTPRVPICKLHSRELILHSRVPIKNPTIPKRTRIPTRSKIQIHHLDPINPPPVTKPVVVMNRRPQFRSTSLLFFAMASFFLLSFLLLLLSLSLPLSITSRRPRYPNPIRPTSSSIVEQACKATRFPSTCVSTLSDLKTSSTPSDLILTSIAASSASLATAQSNAKAIFNASSNDRNRSNAASNCIEHLRYSSHRLGQASIAVSGSRVADAMAWTSAALLYQYDCFSALKYVNGTKQVDDAMWYLISLSNLTSNALSLLFSYRRFGNDTSRWIQPQTERDGYWGDSPNVVGGESGGSLRVGGLLPPDLKENFNARVCKEGGQGNCYRTVQDAVNSAPDFGAERYVIYIMAGVYEETVRVPLEKTNLVFVGDGMGKTVITGSLNAQMVGVTTYNTATVGINGDGFMAKDLTFENTAGPDAHQAVAFRSDSDLSFLQNVEFLGHQDTLYAHSLRQFYMSCRIAGTVDFVFGNSATVFQDCLLLVRPRQLSPEKGETNAVTAQGRTDPSQSTGFVFNNCSVDGTEDYMVLYHSNPAKHKNYLGRPWKEYSRTVFIQCYLGELVRPEGWLPWSGNFALSTLFYGEYESSGPGANAAGRVNWSSQIPVEHVGVYSIQNFIQGGAWIPSGVL